MEYKKLGDSLSKEEYNAYVSLLKFNTTLIETFEIGSSTVKGVYGDYEFDFTDATILDNGILITDETKGADNTVELKNPIFKNSNYILTFKVMDIQDYNVFNEDTDNISYSNFEITLNHTNPIVSLDLSEYKNNLIILFAVNVVIQHNTEITEVA